LSQLSSRIETSAVEDFWSFRRMVTPFVLEIVSMLALVGVAIAGVVVIALGARRRDAGEIGEGVALLLLGPIAARLCFEALIVIFRINDTLGEIHALAVWAAERAYLGDADVDADDATSAS
jgi:ABC-type Fe3+-siderophore transport system permease subunit